MWSWCVIGLPSSPPIAAVFLLVFQRYRTTPLEETNSPWLQAGCIFRSRRGCFCGRFCFFSFHHVSPCLATGFPEAFLNMPGISLAWAGNRCAVTLPYIFNTEENSILEFQPVDKKKKEKNLLFLLPPRSAWLSKEDSSESKRILRERLPIDLQ